MDIVQKRIKYYKEKQAGKMIRQNEKLMKELEELNISAWEARHIYEQTRECYYLSQLPVIV